MFQTPLGVKDRKVNGRYQYQPPTLKFSCVRILDMARSEGRDHLYRDVQNCLEYLLEAVENRLFELDYTGNLWNIPHDRFILIQLNCEKT